MPTSNVTSTSATAPIDRLTLNLDNLRAGTTSDAEPAGGLQRGYICFDAGDE